MSKKIFISAGERSGDIHAARLAAEIKKIDPDISLAGIGGADMASRGVSLFYRTDRMGIIGIPDIFRHLKKIKAMFRLFLEKAERERPDLAILVDYPGFNLALAGALKKRGVRVVYYVSPQVWAWGRWRIKRIKKYVEKMIVFFKFEKELYERHGVNAEFVGHPLLSDARPSVGVDEARKNLGLEEKKKTIALLPGSRAREIAALLPVMAGAVKKLYKRHNDIQVLIVRSANLEKEIFEAPLKGLEAPYRIIENTGGELYNCLSVSDLAVVSSGTAALECAVMGTPMIIVYKVSLFTAIAMKLFIRTRFIGLVNILAGREIAPELIQFECTENNVLSRAERVLFEPGASESMRKDLAEVKNSLGDEGASRRAAQSVVALMGKAG